ncbi:MAG: acetyl-CoA carboxylase biotin carboxylase subunit [Acidobacteria bacterium]|jgi:acetyl-CoA carboxylase biotin carboxylase subunit|nr:acetyl-CoA carboxylase biotin carboxylase subunit [Acidobacteriota bacterium]
MFKRILIANRGEVALRIINACKKLKIETVAAYSTADKDSPHLAQADMKVCIGPGPSSQSYLNMEAILQAALNTECQAIHPGFGFMSENALFSYMCGQQKLAFIGPTPNSIRLMGNKSQAKQTTKQAGLPTIPGSDGNLKDLDHAIRLANEFSYPVLLKATAGGGGKGIRPCYTEEELRTFYPQARFEAEKAFGNGDLYLEKLILNGRHIEFQILADSYNNVIHLGERECSIQRKNQKLIEESPSPAVDQEKRRAMGTLAAESIKKIGYVNAGTIEFLMDENKNLYFMEMNTRLQVEHPVTEMVTGIDIVAEQIKIAANHALSLKQEQVTFQGHAIECRINAEDPANNFAPSPGVITSFNPPANPGPGKIRLDTHVAAGYEIPSFYDSMICKLIAHGEDRAAAIQTMINALKTFEIKGIKTTIPLHLEILAAKFFNEGNYNTGSLSTLLR